MAFGQCMDLLKPPPLPAPSVQLTDRMLRESRHGNLQEGGETKETSSWLSDLSLLMKQPSTRSVIVDAEFIRQIGDCPEQWASLLTVLELPENSSTIQECQVDLRQMTTKHRHITVSRLETFLKKTTRSKRADGEDGSIQKLSIFGLTTYDEVVLTLLPTSLIELTLFFGSELNHANDDDEDNDASRNRRQRVDRMIQHYVAAHPCLSSITITQDANADGLLPVSAYSLTSLIRCPLASKIEFIHCDISIDEEEELGDAITTSPEQAVFEALRDNTSLVILRLRSGSINTLIAHHIVRAIEVGNRHLRHLDIGDMEGCNEDVASNLSKALLRNNVMEAIELNLNSISNFHWCTLANLNCMDISDNYLRDEGALQIAQLIPACRLDRMNLADNCIGAIGGSAIAWSLMHNKTITKINICDNPLLDPEAGEGPASDVTARIYNTFKHTPAYKQGFLGMLCSSLRHNQNLKFLNLANTGLDDSHGPLLAILFRVSSLDGIGLLRNSLGDDACLYICKALAQYRTTLRVLMLEMNPISSSGFYAIWKGALLANDTLLSVQVGRQKFLIGGVERGQEDLDIVLRLNQAGLIRMRKDKNATREQWINALIELRNELDCTYTLLSENPIVLRHPTKRRS